MNYDGQMLYSATESERVTFYKKTYTHVAIAILAFILVETLLIQLIPESVIYGMISSKWIWIAILGAFWLISSFTDKLAFSESQSTQYLGLGLFVLIEAIIFLPMIYIALSISNGANIIQQAAIVTLAMFAGLSAIVFFTNKDFSFLRSALIIGGFVSIGLIIAGAIFGFDLGLWFSVGMVVLASGGILYQTSQLKNDFATDQYVGAALKLFASVMLLFWYVLRIFMSRKD